METLAVTLTPNFFDLHQTRAPPMILLQNNYMMKENKIVNRLYSLDLTHEKPCIRKFDATKLIDPHFVLGGSCGGLLLLRDTCLNYSRLSICNPLTGRVVMRVIVEANYCYGFWFHPFKKEYLLLTISGLGADYCYKIYNLRGESSVIGSYAAIPSYDLPINISCSLYYMLRDPVPPGHCIMIFNTETETIDFKCHPHSGHCLHGDTGNPTHGNVDMRLLEIEESLAFAHMCSGMDNSLYLWILVDRATWHWIERYKVNLNWNSDIERPLNLEVCPMNVQKGELLMLYNPDRLIAFNLETRPIRKIDLNIVPFDCITNLVSTTRRSSLVGLHRLASGKK